MDVLIVLLVVLAVVVLVGAPLRAGGGPAAGGEEGDLAALEAAKEAKYREIRDAELDYRAGKLSREDHAALDRALRQEAIALLRRLDAARERPGGRGRAVG